jgi:hypothetical protein
MDSIHIFILTTETLRTQRGSFLFAVVSRQIDMIITLCVLRASVVNFYQDEIPSFLKIDAT